MIWAANSHDFFMAGWGLPLIGCQEMSPHPSVLLGSAIHAEEGKTESTTATLETKEAESAGSSHKGATALFILMASIFMVIAS